MSDYIIPNFTLTLDISSAVDPQPLISTVSVHLKTNATGYLAYEPSLIYYKRGGVYYREESAIVYHDPYNLEGETGDDIEPWTKVNIGKYFARYVGPGMAGGTMPLLDMWWTCEIDSNRDLDLTTLVVSDWEGPTPDEDTTISDYKRSHSSIAMGEGSNRSMEDYVWGYDADSGLYMWLYAGDGADVLAAGGGRYNQQLVAVGHNCVYYGSL